MPCAAPSRNNLGVLGPCAFPVVTNVGGVDVSAQNLCLPHYSMKYGLAAIPKGVVGGGIDANTVLCFHADTLVDERGHPLTAFGDAKIDLTQFKFGSGSLALDGAGDYLSTPDSPDWAFGGGDFTLDLWAYFTNVGATNQALIGQFPGSPGQYSWLLRYNVGTLNFYSSVDGTALVTASWSWIPTVNTWYHVALVRSGSNVLLFINGTQVGAAQAVAATLIDSNQVLTIGANSTGTSWYFNGYLDEVRISKTARWTANFSVPSTPYS